MKPVKYYTEAAREYRETVDYYESCREGLGLEFADAMMAAEHHIAQHPKASSQYKMEFRRKVLRRFPYAIFYVEFEEYIWIAAVANCHRNEGYWILRQPE